MKVTSNPTLVASLALSHASAASLRRTGVGGADCGGGVALASPPNRTRLRR
jgi:hypothetical protein